MVCLIKLFFDLQSREYKYNRQAFDQKALSMTEKYAQPGASGKICGSQLTIQSQNLNMVIKSCSNVSFQFIFLLFNVSNCLSF